MEAEFEDEIVEPFERGYLAGETPNPCVDCNPLRLAALVALADELGVERLVTGHYARIVRRDGEPFVARAADRRKDQSYMLWAVPPEVLARLEFPLGESTKAEVREAAADAGLEVAGEPESQEVCFAGDGYQRFLEERGVDPAEGDVLDASGAVLGRHQGHWRFTVGQRRGIGVSAAEPLYVLERRAAGNEVVVGGRDALAAGVVRLRDVVDRGLGDGRGLEVQLRYRSAAVPVRALRRDCRRAGSDAGRAVRRARPGPVGGVLPRRRRRRRRADRRRRAQPARSAAGMSHGGGTAALAVLSFAP